MGKGRRMHSGMRRFHDFALLRQTHLIQQNLPLLYRPLSRNETIANVVGTTANLSHVSNPNQSSICPNFFNADVNRDTRHAKDLNVVSGRRSLFTASTSKVLSEIHLKLLERNANANPLNSELQASFLRELSSRYPEAAILRFESASGLGLAVDERCALEYLGALGRLDAIGPGSGGRNSMNRFDLQRLKQILAASTGNVNPLTIQALSALQERVKERGHTMIDPETQKEVRTKPISKSQQVMAAIEVLNGGHIGDALGALGTVSPAAFAGIGASSVAGGTSGRGAFNMPALGLPKTPVGAGGPGVDPSRPLHVVIDSASTSIRMQLFKLARTGLYMFFLLSLIGAIMDEKGGLSRAIGGGGKTVQEAEGSNVRFEDVKGVDEAKEELQEIVEYLKSPEKFTRLGGKLPRGLLLTGPPGTGKTMLAKAIAGEADVPFFFSSGSQFEEMYVGVGAKRVRELFDAAKEKAPCIIFIDEIDAVGGSRKLKDQSALKMTLNELLVQMDGFEENNGIIVIGATNFKESLDSALLRPGRFDKHVVVPLPDVAGRKEILEMYAKKTKLSPDVDLSVIARGTPGFSGADLFNLMNQAALKASVDGLNAITMATMEFSKDKILMGAERKSAVITAETARCTAFHEAGHALVAVLTEGAMPIHKATIMPRGQALGYVAQLPEGDQTSQSKKEMLARLDVCMGGRIAEELVFGHDNVTSGASSDIQQATQMARAMVTKFGMSEKVGVVFYDGSSGEQGSDQTRALIDKEVQRLVNESYQRATDLLKKHTKTHTLLAETLLEYETLTGDEVRDLVKNGKKPSRPVMNDKGGAKGDQSIFGNVGGKSKSSVTGKGVGGKVPNHKDRGQ